MRLAEFPRGQRRYEMRLCVFIARYTDPREERSSGTTLFSEKCTRDRTEYISITPVLAIRNWYRFGLLYLFTSDGSFLNANCTLRVLLQHH